MYLVLSIGVIMGGSFSRAYVARCKEYNTESEVCQASFTRIK